MVEGWAHHTLEERGTQRGHPWDSPAEVPIEYLGRDSPTLHLHGIFEPGVRCNPEEAGGPGPRLHITPTTTLPVSSGAQLCDVNHSDPAAPSLGTRVEQGSWRLHLTFLQYTYHGPYLLNNGSKKKEKKKKKEKGMFRRQC